VPPTHALRGEQPSPSAGAVAGCRQRQQTRGSLKHLRSLPNRAAAFGAVASGLCYFHSKKIEKSKYNECALLGDTHSVGFDL